MFYAKNKYFVNSVILTDLTRHTTIADDSYRSKTNPYITHISMYDNSQLEVSQSIPTDESYNSFIYPLFQMSNGFLSIYLCLNAFTFGFILSELPKNILE